MHPLFEVSEYWVECELRMEPCGVRGAHYRKSKTRVKNEMAFKKLGCCSISVPRVGGVTVSVWKIYRFGDDPMIGEHGVISWKCPRESRPG